MTSSQSKSRISVRVSKAVHEQLQTAADSTGVTLSQFLVRAALEKADQIQERRDAIRLSARDAEWLLTVLDRPPRPPNAKLQKALDWYQSRK